MAWTMGYVEHFDGCLENGSLYIDWLEPKSGGLSAGNMRRATSGKASRRMRARGLSVRSSLPPLDIILTAYAQSRSCGADAIPGRKSSSKKSSSSAIRSQCREIQERTRRATFGRAKAVGEIQERPSEPRLVVNAQDP